MTKKRINSFQFKREWYEKIIEKCEYKGKIRKELLGEIVDVILFYMFEDLENYDFKYIEAKELWLELVNDLEKEKTFQLKRNRA